MKYKAGRNGHHRTYMYLIAASLAALMFSTFASWFFYSRWNETEELYTAQLSDLSKLSQTYNMLKHSLDEAFSDLSQIRDENFNCIQLVEVDSSKRSNVRVFYNPVDGETYIHVLLLPTPPPGSFYRLWSKNGKEAPLDAGIIDFSSSSMQHVKSSGNATAWAVSLEGLGLNSVQPAANFILQSQDW